MGYDSLYLQNPDRVRIPETQMIRNLRVSLRHVLVAFFAFNYFSPSLRPSSSFLTLSRAPLSQQAE